MDFGQHQHQWPGEDRSATLEQPDRQRAAMPVGFTGGQRQTQRSGRRVILGSRRTHQETQAVGRRRHRLQPTQRIVPCQRLLFGQPGQQRTERGTLQAFHDRPQSIGRSFGSHDQHATHVDAELAPAGGIRNVRRREQHDLATRTGQRRQRRGEKADLAHAGVREQQFGETTRRPATPRQLFVQHPETARRRRQAGGRQRIAPPEATGQSGVAQYGLGPIDGRWRSRDRRLGKHCGSIGGIAGCRDRGGTRYRADARGSRCERQTALRHQR